MGKSWRFCLTDRQFCFLLLPIGVEKELTLTSCFRIWPRTCLIRFVTERGAHVVGGRKEVTDGKSLRGVTPSGPTNGTPPSELLTASRRLEFSLLRLPADSMDFKFFILLYFESTDPSFTMKYHCVHVVMVFRLRQLFNKNIE